MKTQKQMTLYQAKQSTNQQAIQAAQQQETFTNHSINIVVLSLALIAFLPLLLDPNFYQMPPLNMILALVAGLLYAFVGTVGMRWYESRMGKRPWLKPAYFVVQITIIAFLFWVVGDLDNSLWLLILPVAAQSLSLPRWGTAVVSFSLLATIYFSFLQSAPMADAIQALLQIGAAMLFTILFTTIAVRETAARFRVQQLATELHKANVRLAEYAAQAEELATTKERNRVAREIHDSLGHYLTVINVQIEAARMIMPGNPTKADDALNKAQKLTQEGLTAVRQSISALRESPLENQTLPEAIARLAAETQNTGIVTNLKVVGTAVDQDAKINLALFRVAQEGLTNVRKHALASQVMMTLAYDRPDWITLTVADNGVGTAVNDNNGFGLIGIRERIQLLGGELTVKTAPNAGFSLIASVPAITGPRLPESPPPE
jgi:signal transduction histidine kinase